MGLKAKESVRARNSMMMAGIAVLILGDLCYAFIPSMLGKLVACPLRPDSQAQACLCILIGAGTKSVWLPRPDLLVPVPDCCFFAGLQVGSPKLFLGYLSDTGRRACCCSMLACFAQCFYLWPPIGMALGCLCVGMHSLMAGGLGYRLT